MTAALERIPFDVNLSTVMPSLVPGIHVFRAFKQDVDGRDKPGHDDGEIE